MKFEGAGGRDSRARDGILAKRRLSWLAAGALLSIPLVAGGSYLLVSHLALPGPREALGEWAAARGYRPSDETRITQLLAKVASGAVRAPFVPKIMIDVKFVDMEKLKAQRDRALAERTLIQGEDDYVSAKIRHDDRTSRVSLRLKGDFTDHLMGKKWSLRIHVKGDDQIFGMRRFSIQNPVVRNFQREALFFEYLRSIGVLAPRYFFVAVTLNGEDIGIMAVEEHFSKELLESQGKKEGVIVKFDESLFWQERSTRGINAWRTNRITSYLNSPFEVFRRSYVARSPALSRQFGVAVGLLRGFIEGKLPASEVFEPRLMGAFLAASEIWHTRHGLFWNNYRFYLNPITLMLEPVGFDAGATSRPPSRGLIAWQEPFVTDLLEDPRIFEEYRDAIQSLAQELLEGDVVESLKRSDRRHLEILHGEFFLLEPHAFDLLKLRARNLAGLTEAQLANPVERGESFPALIQAHVIDTGQAPYLEIGNLVPYPVEVRSVRWVADDGALGAPLEPLPGPAIPLRLEPTPVFSLPRSERIFFPAQETNGQHLRLEAVIVGDERVYTTRARNYFARIERHPLAASTLGDPVARKPYLHVDEATREMRVAPGRWAIDTDLIVPRGFHLIVPAGTTLRFASGKALIAQGDLQFSGTPGAPVVLEGAQPTSCEGSWQGVAVMDAPGTSRWSHVIVRHTSGIDRPPWQLTGGVTFYRSDVELEHSAFSCNSGEDALNLIGGRFRLEGIEMTDVMSDGLDIDFADGVIQGGTFRRIGSVSGGDALDLSGSTATIEGTTFEDIRDKAISVGEGSEVSIRDLVIEGSTTGVASKDGSRLEIQRASFKDIRHAALMAYTKKSTFGPGRIEARDLAFDGVTSKARVQTGSQIDIDGEPVESEAINVEELYETIMRPGLRK
jgi:hypothetical protein